MATQDLDALFEERKAVADAANRKLRLETAREKESELVRKNGIRIELINLLDRAQKNLADLCTHSPKFKDFIDEVFAKRVKHVWVYEEHGKRTIIIYKGGTHMDDYYEVRLWIDFQSFKIGLVYSTDGDFQSSRERKPFEEMPSVDLAEVRGILSKFSTTEGLLDYFFARFKK